MNGYVLPASLSIGGADFAIRTDFRAILDILVAQSDEELDEWCKTAVMVKILYPDWKDIPPEHMGEAIEKACEFIDCGQEDDGRKHPKLVDWGQDAGLIIPAINKVAHTEVRALQELHWWTFFSYFMEIGESLFSNVIHVREKKANHKKMEQWEKDFYKDNKKLIDFKTDIYERSEEEKQALADLWG